MIRCTFYNQGGHDSGNVKLFKPGRKADLAVPKRWREGWGGESTQVQRAFFGLAIRDCGLFDSNFLVVLLWLERFRRHIFRGDQQRT